MAGGVNLAGAIPMCMQIGIENGNLAIVCTQSGTENRAAVPTTRVTRTAAGLGTTRMEGILTATTALTGHVRGQTDAHIMPIDKVVRTDSIRETHAGRAKFAETFNSH